jgi:hypothetical protein
MASSGSGADADGVFVHTAHHNRFEPLEVINSQNFGVHFGLNTSFNEVIESWIHHNGFAGSPITNGHGLYIFEGNDVYENQGYGFHIYSNNGPRLDPSRNVVRQSISDIKAHCRNLCLPSRRQRRALAAPQVQPAV